MDDDWQYIVFEFNMNYTAESVRNGYLEAKRKESENNLDDDILKQLGFDDSDILQM